MKISVILPAYNEEGPLKEIILRIYQVLGKDTEVIVVDDFSSDKTAEVSLSLGAKVLRNPYNMGNGAAVKRGLKEASGDIVVLMDADGQHLPEEIPKLLEDIDKYDMVIGTRSKEAHTWGRRIANQIYNILASYVTDIKVKDLTSGFRAIKREKALEFIYLIPNTFSYPSTLTLSFLKAAYPVKFVPVKVLKRKKGKSKINIINDGLRFLIIIMRITVFFSPLKVFLPASLFFAGIGILYYFYTFINYHRFTNMSALLLTTAVIIFMLGLISEQIASLRLDKRNL